MRDNTSPRTLSPVKSGKTFGKLKPSLDKGKPNRKERRQHG